MKTLTSPRPSPLLALLLALAAPACAAPAPEDVDPELVGRLGDGDVDTSAIAPPGLGPTPYDPCLVFGPVLPPSSGSVDTSFGCRGTGNFTTSDADFTVRGMAVQADDKIVVVGSRFRIVGNNNDLWVARFDANGSVDTTFATGGMFTTDLTAPLGGGESAQAVAIVPGGGIVVGGYVNREDGELREGILLRLTPAGALDPAFGTGGMVRTPHITSFNAVRYDAAKGDLVVGGEKCAYSCTPAVGRYAATTGIPTATFSTLGARYTHFGGASPASGGAVAVTGDDILFGGHATTLTSSSSGYTNQGLVRYTPSGTRDAAFGFPTFDDGRWESVTGIQTYPFSRFVTSARVTTASLVDQFVVRRLHLDGTNDTGFGTSGKVVVPFYGNGASAAALLVRGVSTVAVGTAKTTSGKNRAAVVRLTSTGALDTSFSADGWAALTAGNDEAAATAVAVQSTGHIIVAGWSMNTDWKRKGFVTRLVP